MATSRINVVADTSQAQRALDALQTKVGNISGAFSRLQGVVSGIAFGAVIGNVLRFADNLQDLSDATGIATQNLLGFQIAVQQSGGSVEGADKAILRLVNTIGEAADGSASAQNAFADVGVSLRDLRTLSEQDILKKVITGLGNITDKSEQARLKTALLGKEMRGVAVEDLANRYATATAESVRYAESVRAAAETQAKLEEASKKFSLALLEALGPLAEFISGIKITKELITDLIVAVGALGVAFAAFGNLTPLGRAISLVTGGLVALYGAWNVIKQEAGAIKDFFGIKPSMPDQTDAETKRLERQNEASKKQADTVREVVDALAKRRQEIEKASRAFSEQNANIIDNINLEKSFVGKSQEYIEVEKAREEVLKRAATETQRLREAKAALGKDEQGLAAVYDKQIAKISQQAQVDADRVARATEGLVGLRMVEQARLKDIENTTKAIEAQMQRQQQLGDILRGAISQQRDAEFEGAQAGRSPFERQMESIKENARKAALEAGRAFADTFEDSGDGLSVEQAAELAAGLEQIAQRYQQIAETQIANLNYSRSFAAGWKEAFDEYVDNATNAANIAKQAFQSLTSNMESALDTFVKTGKLNFGDFARSVIQDLLKIQLRAAAINMFKAVGSGNFLGSLFGFAKGGYISTNKPVLVGENGPELVSGAAGMTVTPNWKMNQGGGQSVTNNYYNISAVDAKGVAQLFAENRMTLLGTVRQAEKELPFRGR